MADPDPFHSTAFFAAPSHRAVGVRTRSLRCAGMLALAAALWIGGCASPTRPSGVWHPGAEQLGSEVDGGMASWYGDRFHGRQTASGEAFDMRALTAAHKTLPFGARVRVRNLDNGREVVVRINDRGPFTRGRVIDLSHAAADAIGMVQSGTARVAVYAAE